MDIRNSVLFDWLRGLLAFLALLSPSSPNITSPPILKYYPLVISKYFSSSTLFIHHHPPSLSPSPVGPVCSNLLLGRVLISSVVVVLTVAASRLRIVAVAAVLAVATRTLLVLAVVAVLSVRVGSSSTRSRGRRSVSSGRSNGSPSHSRSGRRGAVSSGSSGRRGPVGSSRSRGNQSISRSRGRGDGNLRVWRRKDLRRKDLLVITVVLVLQSQSRSVLSTAQYKIQLWGSPVVCIPCCTCTFHTWRIRLACPWPRGQHQHQHQQLVQPAGKGPRREW
ncbi:hypothetical protein B0I35DRAFT_170439 [Stachybotrys elegans]|uniref:Uncharacterized protein n=1 Tax=Stachybotrys elegans TaxID=80388 RepID=A0A8K0T372_9HYPO|nr:hypothetical protein B0I35DRAFT_170439 [Stachybotrys elegans]